MFDSSPSESSRREAPTPRKLRRARRAGDLARSPFAVGAAVTVAVALAISWVDLGRLTGFARDTWALRPLSPGLGAGVVSAGGLATGGFEAAGLEAGRRAMALTAELLAPLLTVAVVVAALAYAVVTRPTWRTAAPGRAARGSAGPFARGTDAVWELFAVCGGRTIVVWVLAAIAAGLSAEVLERGLPEPIYAQPTRLAELPDALRTFAHRSGGFLLAAAIGAAVFARRRWWRRQAMTRHERRDELRETEGAPLTRRRRARSQRELRRATSGVVLVVRGSQAAFGIRWLERDQTPTVSPLVPPKWSDGAGAAVWDEALAVELSRVPAGSAVPRSLWSNLARHLARSGER